MGSAAIAGLAGMTFLVVMIIAVIDLINTSKGRPATAPLIDEELAQSAMSHDRPVRDL